MFALQCKKCHLGRGDIAYETRVSVEFCNDCRTPGYGGTSNGTDRSQRDQRGY